MSQILAVTSGKGGVGKSTVAIGVSLAFCRMGKKVLLIDMDEGLRCLDLILGVEEQTVFDLADILLGSEAENAIYRVPGIEGLSLIPAPAKAGMIDPFSFTRFAKEIAEKFDTVIFDFPAGMDFTLYPCLPAGALYLTVATPDPVSVRDAAAVSDQLEALACPARLVINNFRYSLLRHGLSRNIDEMIDTAGLQLLGVIPHSEELASLSITHSLPKNCKASAAFLRLAKRLNGEHVLLPKLKKL